MPIFIPILVLGGSVAISVGVGYILDRTIGDGDYTKQDLAVDVTLGLIPGVGLLKPMGRIGMHAARVARVAEKGDTAGDVAMGMIYLSRHEIKPISKTLIAGHAVSAMYDHAWTTAFDPLVVSLGEVLPAADGSGTAGHSPSQNKLRKYRPKVEGKCKKGFFYSKKEKMCIPYKK